MKIILLKTSRERHKPHKHNCDGIGHILFIWLLIGEIIAKQHAQLVLCLPHQNQLLIASPRRVKIHGALM